MNAQRSTLLRRDFDARRINLVVNDPEVKRWIAPEGAGELDLSSSVSDLRNVLLCRDDGGTLFVSHGPGVYELHTMFLPSAGLASVRFVRAALAWMFLRSDCMEMFTRVPASNVRARRFTESFGPVLQHEGPGNGPNGPEEVAIFRMSWSDWVLRAGLSERAQEVGLGPDAWVGATVAALCAGAVDKSLVLYNRWASIAGYPSMGLAQREPQVIVSLGERLFVATNVGLEPLI